MEADFLIVGAGIAGASTAYHLRRQGATGVVLLEKETSPGEHSTGRNAAILRARLRDPHRRALAEEGAAAIRSGELAEFRRTGGLVICPEGTVPVEERVPLARGRAVWYPDDGVADPAGLLAAYLRGQDVRYKTTLLGWDAQDAGVVARTSAGPIRARVLVNAAGPWAGALGQLPLTPLNRHLYVTAPMPAVHPDWPYVWDDVCGLYFRPDSGGLLLSPCDERARPPGDYRVDPEATEMLADKLSASQPQLADVAIRTCWSGQRTFAPDKQFVIGFDPRWPALFHVAGLAGHGITTSWAVGRCAAEQLLAGRRAADNPFDPARLLP